MKKALNIFKLNFVKILILSLMIILPVYLMQEFLLVPFTPELPTETDLETLESYSVDSSLLWFFFGAILLSLLTELYKIGIIKLSYESLESRNISVSEIMDSSMRIWPKTILTTLLYSLFVACGFMLFFIPGMIMYVLYFFYMQIVVITGIWGRGSFLISSLYVKKMLNKTIGLVLFGIVLQYSVSLLASVAQLAISNSIVSSAAAVVIFFLGQFAITYMDILATVLLYDTKLDISIDAFRKTKRENNGEH